MCLIVDANVVHQLFPSASPDFEPIHEALVTGRAKLVYGGFLTQEYLKTTLSRRFLRRLDQQGAAKQFPDSVVDSETRRLRREAKCRSNDPHILALAIVSNARLLCSQDEELGSDFRSPSILPPPRGSVYKRAEHAHLIRAHCD